MISRNLAIQFVDSSRVIVVMVFARDWFVI